MVVKVNKVAGLLILIRMGTIGLGLLTVESHRAYEAQIKSLNPSWRLGVFLDGRERTNDLTASDDRRGWVAGFLRKPGRDGRRQAYLDINGQVAKFVRSGAVEYRLVTADV